MEQRRVISTEVRQEEEKFENSLRPQSLKEYIGQEKIKKNMEIYIKTAKERNESLDH